MNKVTLKFDKDARSEAISYQQILDTDSKPVPENLRAQAAPYLGSDPLPVANYTSQEQFDREAEKMWMRVWQLACREEEIPNVGDHIVYDIVGKSVIVVRSGPDRVQAFYNTCLHRGRKLVTERGCKHQFRCPFHGFTWNVDGSFKEHPFPWDFQHLSDDDLKLPEIRVGTWAGFVFVNFDDDAPDLMEVLGALPAHFDHLRLQDKYIAFHVGKVIHANWKVVSEAFMESHHTVDTHPQIMPFLADENSQYDVFSDYITRQISALGVPSPHLPADKATDQIVADALFEQLGMAPPDGKSIDVPEGKSVRAYAAQALRSQMGAADGNDYEEFCDAEMLDSILYNVYPNFSVWAGISQALVYRWRPNGRDVNSCLMEVYSLSFVPKNGERPKPAQLNLLSEEQTWTAAEEMGGLGGILNQDLLNLPHVQQGLISSGNGEVQLANYQEMRIRQHHIMTARYLNDEI